MPAPASGTSSADATFASGVACGASFTAVFFTAVFFLLLTAVFFVAFAVCFWDLAALRGGSSASPSSRAPSSLSSSSGICSSCSAGASPGQELLRDGTGSFSLSTQLLALAAQSESDQHDVHALVSCSTVFPISMSPTQKAKTQCQNPSALCSRSKTSNLMHARLGSTSNRQLMYQELTVLFFLSI